MQFIAQEVQLQAFMVFRDRDDQDLRHVVPLKANLAQGDPPQLEFRLSDGQMMARVSTEEVNVDEHLNPRPGPRPREKEQAKDWLEALFTERSKIPVTEIEEAAKADGISTSTLKRAKKAAGGIISKKEQTPDGEEYWVWQKITVSSVE
jgi:hypothetical protein